MTIPARASAAPRRGAALVLVLIMTAALAALALSAIYLTQGGTMVGRLYEREQSFRYAADAALALGKARLQTDTLFDPPDTGVVKLMSGEQITDAQGDTLAGVLMDLYAGSTGDTTGRFGSFVTLVARAYDAGGTRHVRRLDLTGESFSRYTIFTNTFPSTQRQSQPGDLSQPFSALAFRGGEFTRGRVHSNQNWRSCCGAPVYFDTVTMAGRRVDTVITTWMMGSTTTPDYRIAPRESVPVIPYPTVEKLAALPGYATRGNLRFKVTLTNTSMARSDTFNVSGKHTNPAWMPQMGRDSIAVSGGTRLEFFVVDLDKNGDIAEREGFFRLFRGASGIDTIRIRGGDRNPFNATGASEYPFDHPVLLNQCGVWATIAGRDEFYPLASVWQPWVRRKLRSSTNPTYTDADTTRLRMKPDTMRIGTFVTNIIQSGYTTFFGKSRLRCYPAGSPQLMLTERLTARGTCTPLAGPTIPTEVLGWGADSTCTDSQRYGGQDTTFTPVAHTCRFSWRPDQSRWSGACTDRTGQAPAPAFRLGEWVQAPADIAPPVAGWTSAGRLSVEQPYAWSLAKPYNLNTKGVIYAEMDTSAILYVSGTQRGFTTLYSGGRVGLIDDLTYDKNPTAQGNLCRNFLGIIAVRDVMISETLMNMMYSYPDNQRYMLLGANEDFFLDGIVLSLRGTFGAENWENGPAWNVRCPKGTYTGAWWADSNSTRGGCVTHNGGIIVQRPSLLQATFTTGFRDNKTVDPCQLTNAKPPYFPMTKRYLDNKYYELDPAVIRSDSAVNALFRSLRSG